MTALQTVQAESVPDGLATALILDIKALTVSFEFCLLSHTLREGNSTTADFLASLGHSSPHGTTFLPSPPSAMASLLLGDAMEILFPRM
ncbi:hypothetical protein SLA2020_040240 [Shorea laevis]